MSTPDKALQALVNVIDHMPGMGIGITMTVDGTVLTGMLIPAEEYASNVAMRVRKAHNFTSPESRGFDMLFNQLEADAREHREQHEAAFESDDPSSDPEPTGFLHLRNAFTITGDHVPGGDGAYWRVRLADVSAWTLSVIGAEQA